VQLGPTTIVEAGGHEAGEARVALTDGSHPPHWQEVHVQADIIRGAPYFPVSDVSSIGSYYRDVLGFRCEYAAGDPPEFAVYSRNGSPVMFRRVQDPSLICPNERQGGAWDVFFWVNDVEALHGELAQKGAVVVYPPVVQPYGMKEFAVRDSDGYVLGFGQEWPAAGGPTP
jgi:catechol 2,3-dioxygenase-like lactoylglutathione lyase family enzyme